MTLPDEIRSLKGRRILVTRAAHQAGKLSEGLRALGAEPVEVPVLEIRPPESFAALDAALYDIAGYDWLIFTSSNAVRAVIERAHLLSLAFGISVNAKVAAIGESTAHTLRDAGLQVDFVPASYLAESLVEGLASYWPGQRILLARAAPGNGVQPRDVIPDALRAAGAHVDVVDAYRNVLPVEAPERLREVLAQPIDAVTFTSSSSVTHLAHAAEQAEIPFPLAGVPAISIGPITTQTLHEMGWEPAAEANPHDIPGLIAAVADLLTR
jgi:uroporphyrinogen-III synthase